MINVALKNISLLLKTTKIVLIPNIRGVSLIKRKGKLTCEPLFEFWGRGHVHRALPVAVDQRWVSTMTQQQRTNFHTILGGSLVQRGELPEVHGINTRPMLQKNIQGEITLKGWRHLRGPRFIFKYIENIMRFHLSS